MLQIKNETGISLVVVKKWSNIEVELEFLKKECLYFSIIQVMKVSGSSIKHMHTIGHAGSPRHSRKGDCH